MTMIVKMIKATHVNCIQQSIDVTTVPAISPELEVTEKKKGTSSVITYLKTDFFNVYEWDVIGELSLKRRRLYVGDSRRRIW